MSCGNLPAFYVIFSDKWPHGRQTTKEVSKVCGNLDCWRKKNHRKTKGGGEDFISISRSGHSYSHLGVCGVLPPKDRPAGFTRQMLVISRKGGHRDVNDEATVKTPA